MAQMVLSGLGFGAVAARNCKAQVTGDHHSRHGGTEYEFVRVSDFEYMDGLVVHLGEGGVFGHLQQVFLFMWMLGCSDRMIYE
jgi:hypothetical protein